MADHDLESSASSNPPSTPGGRDVVAEFASFQELLAECASKLSEEGIFVATPVHHEVGSQVTFEVRIRDGFSVLRGEGEVAQVGSDGAALRFLYLDQPSLRLLPKLVEHYRRAGTAPLELPTPVPPAVEEPELEAELELESESVLEEEAVEPSGLTLDDLEAEFLISEPQATQESEGADEGPAAAEPVLVDAEELAPEVPRADDFGPTDIRFEDLLAEGAEESDLAAGLESEEPALEIDPGLPWLTEETQKSRKGDLWVILLLVLIGALLGAALYYYFVRGRTESSEQLPVRSGQLSAYVEPPNQVVEEPALALTVPAALPKKPAAGVVLPPPALNGIAAAEKESRQPESPLTGVDRITWNERAGETVVILWADGSFTDAQVERIRVVGGAPRELVKIKGIGRPCPRQQIDVGTDHVRRIRTGLHESSGIPSLHVVADLADGEVEVQRTETEGSQLRLYFSKTG